MRLLVLGGTRFFGRDTVELAVAAGHQVTVFHRGMTHPGTLSGVEVVLGDREQSLEVLRHRHFDAVLDTSGYTAEAVRLSTETLRDQIGHYLFVSTVSVYADGLSPGITEISPLRPSDPTSDRTQGDYGGMKVACEQVAREVLADRVGIVRPGLIGGPRDYTDRMTYWLARLDTPEEVLVPEIPRQPVQFIDPRDLAAFCLHWLTSPGAGTWNAVGESVTFGDLLSYMHRLCGEKAHPTRVTPEFLQKHGVEPWQDLPLWTGEHGPALGCVDSSLAIQAGLRRRPWQETVRDTLEWHRARGNVALVAGLSPERERELLRVWRQAVIS